ncbi:hypothetical protein HELRODRAFT_158821 [Helobdella robusta]|uniref:HTH CENPB-type domain-containing protein n=1 Tax=Helobdella robusta TaxID=6412 RepID=T1ENB1_HELRO|nr:hypothetical protein HELRODRAFT_158821 [Helobdella robusta]ESO12325.1 hypothetical protein HELRODRAFT_158821 [Helobdella robusta]
MMYGISTKECRKIAYEMTKINGIRFPTTWKTEECAGLKWFRLFMKRHPSLSIRSPEACSLLRATSFNRHNIGQFYKNIEKIFLKSPQLADPSRIFNLNKTVQKRCSKVVGAKGMKQVNQATSAEKGSLVTTCCIICANGTFLLPVMVFPRVRFQKRMLKGGPVGTLGLAGKTGWMTAELFLPCPSVLDHLDPTYHIFSSTSSYTGQLAPVTFLTPEQFKGYPKAGNGKTNNKKKEEVS